MLLDLLAHFGCGVPIEVVREIGDYRFAANHGFTPFKNDLKM